MPYEIDIPALKRLTDSDAMTQIGMNDAAGEGVMVYLKAFLHRLDMDRPNLLGGERSHFYDKASQGVTKETDTDGSYLTIHQLGFRQRLLGGTIHAQAGKNLTIPAIAEAYGHAAPEFDLIFNFGIFKATGLKALSEKAAPHRVFYWLKESVYLAADPTVLPDNEAMAQAATTAVREYLTKITDQNL